MKVVGYILNDWQLSGIWTAQTGGGYQSATATKGASAT